jgi:hypothetical protein
MTTKAIGDGSIIDLEPEDDPRLEALRLELRQLKRALSDAQIEAERAREDANRALSALRRQLSPLYRALQAVFGELDAAGVDDASPPTAPTASQPTTRASAIWESWKQKMPGRPAEFITILLAHGEMNVEQLKIAARCGTTAVYETTGKLNKAGLLHKNGGKYSLKPIS